MGGGDTRPFNNHILSARQVEMLLAEVMPDDLKESLRDTGRAEFEYDSPHGPVGMTALRRRGKLSVYVSTARTLEYQDANERSAGAPAIKPSGLGEEPSPEPAEVAEAAAPPQPDETAGDSLWRREQTGLELALESPGLGEQSSFVDATLRPTAASQERRGEPAGRAEQAPSSARAIAMQEPGTEAPIDKYLRVMHEQDCSDLHMTSGNPPMYRKDGEMALIGEMKSLSPSAVEELLLPIMPDRNHEEFIELRDTDFAYEIEGIGRFRCNVFMDRLGPGAVFRIIPEDILTAETLGLSQHILDLCALNKGLVLVTGPTGSGKSTTLAAMIDYINRTRKSHIITVEDPIEFVHPNKKCLINQREVGVHTMSFKNAIRAALREDPDIILVGELRDLETIHMAIETAETGHLVFGTLHTNTAPSTVDRLIDQFPTDRQSQVRTMLSESLRAVIAQTLCKKIGGGRVAALEVLIGNRAVANLIRNAKTHQLPSIMETAKGEGMVALNDSLFALVEQGLVSAEEAHYNAIEKGTLARRLKAAGHAIEASE